MVDKNRSVISSWDCFVMDACISSPQPGLLSPRDSSAWWHCGLTYASAHEESKKEVLHMLIHRAEDGIDPSSTNVVDTKSNRLCGCLHGCWDLNSHVPCAAAWYPVMACPSYGLNHALPVFQKHCWITDVGCFSVIYTGSHFLMEGN